MLRLCSLIICFCIAFPANAVLDIEVTGAGEHQIPISILSFAGEETLDQRITDVITSDLKRTGLFKLVYPEGKNVPDMNSVNYEAWSNVESLVLGKATKQADGRIEVIFRLLDTVKKVPLINDLVSSQSEQLRAIGHRIADLIFEKLTGTRGVFSTRIAYVNRLGKSNRLVIADSDGAGEKTVLKLVQPIMSPAWSPDGKSLAYVSFEDDRAVVYTQSLSSQQRVKLAAFPGSNSAPAWSPDGKQLAVVLTHEGYSQIYLIRSDGSNLQRLSFNESIDTEPTFTPDGRYILFTSDRGGSAQIYRMPVRGGNAERLTFEGSSNFSPRCSPDGKSFVFSQFNNGIFTIALQDFETNQIQLLTTGGWEKKPSFAPNGKLILFATEVNGRGILSTVSSDGRIKQKMTSQVGDIREPIWGPFNGL